MIPRQPDLACAYCAQGVLLRTCHLDLLRVSKAGDGYSAAVEAVRSKCGLGALTLLNYSLERAPTADERRQRLAQIQDTGRSGSALFGLMFSARGFDNPSVLPLLGATSVRIDFLGQGDQILRQVTTDSLRWDDSSMRNFQTAAFPYKSGVQKSSPALSLFLCP